MKWGVNRLTALGLLSAVAVFSAVTFFGVANAMIPDPSGPIEADDMRLVPVLDDSEGVVASAEPAEDVQAEAVDVEVDEVSDTPEVAPEPRPAAHGRRGNGGARGVDAPTRSNETRSNGLEERLNACDPSDPLCGLEFGGRLDA